MPIYKTGKTKDGKQGYRVRVNYKDSSGNYQTKTKIVYGAPEAKLCEMELLAHTSDAAAPSSMTVNDLYDQYIRAKTNEVRATSLDKYKSLHQKHTLPHIGNVKLEKLNASKLQEWKNTIIAKGFTTSTNQHIYGELRALLNFAVKMDYLPTNPLTKLGNFKEVYFEKPQDKLHYYTVDQWRKYVAAAEKLSTSTYDKGFYVFFNIAYYTGMRKGEINALKWSDIDGDMIHVRRSVLQKIKGESIVETPPKNKTSYRDIQMPKKLIEILDEHRAMHKLCDNYSEDFRVCGGVKCLSGTAIENHNQAYAEKAELPHITIHDFRHSHASLLANEGINIQEIARRLGHAKIEMTWNTYSHLYPREEERALKVLNNI